MTALACEIADSLKLIAPPTEGSNIKARIAKAARVTGLSYWRAWDLWYGKARRIDAHEADAVRNAKKLRGEQSTHDLQAIAVEMETLAERLTTLAALGSRQEIDRARALADRVRSLAGGV